MIRVCALASLVVLFGCPSTPTPVDAGDPNFECPAAGCPKGTECAENDYDTPDSGLACKRKCMNPAECPAGEVCRKSSNLQSMGLCGRQTRLVCGGGHSALYSCEPDDDACCGDDPLRGSGCVNTRTNSSHCGGCNGGRWDSPRVCGSEAQCVDGQCVCPDGRGLCGVSLYRKCLDLRTDPENCGACDAGCAANQLCDGGTCSCRPESSCDGGCAQLPIDPQNCGACGVVCATGSCSNGQCQPRTLFTGDSPISSFELSGELVTWIEPSGHSVRRARLDGGEQRLLATGHAVTSGLAVRGERVCWTTSINPATGILCSVDGGTAELVVAGLVASQLGLLEGELLYSSDGGLVSQPLDGGASRAFWSNPIAGFAVVGDDVLLGEAFGTREVRLINDAGVTNLGSSVHPATALTVSPDGRIFVAIGGDVRPLDGGLLISWPTAIRDLAWTPEGLVWADGARLVVLP